MPCRIYIFKWIVVHIARSFPSFTSGFENIMDFTTGQLTFKSNFRGKDCTSGLNATEVISYQYLGMCRLILDGLLSGVKQSCISPRGGRGFSADIKGIFGFKYRKTLSPVLILVSSNNKPSPSTQTTTAAPKPSRVPLTLMLMVIY
jgi:hypothetical protein